MNRKQFILFSVLTVSMWGCSGSKPADPSNPVKLTSNSEITSVPDSLSALHEEKDADRFETVGQISLSSRKPVFAKVCGYQLHEGSWEAVSEDVTPSAFTELSVFFLVEKAEQRSLSLYEEFQNEESGQSGSVRDRTDFDWPPDWTFRLNPSLDTMKSDKTVIAVLAADARNADFSEYEQTFRSLHVDGSVLFTLEFESYMPTELLHQNESDDS